MKILIIALSNIMIIASNCFAQVAINRDGTAVTDTSSMLEVKKGIKSKVRIASLDFRDTAQLELSNKTPAGEGTSFLITAKRESGLYFSTVSDLLGNNNDSLLIMQTNGRIGVGKKAPQSKLDVNGDINFTGALKLSNLSGTAGQVLTSGGVAAPQWRTTALSNNVRFAVKVGLTNAPSILTGFRGGVLSVVDSIYNLDPTAVSLGVGGTNIVIKRSGLYHFEGFYTAQFFYNAFTTSSPPTNQAYVAFGYSGGFNYPIAHLEVLQRSQTSTTSYTISKNFNTEIYIEAPKTINFYSAINNVLGPTNTVIQQGIFYGHLISD